MIVNNEGYTNITVPLSEVPEGSALIDQTTPEGKVMAAKFMREFPLVTFESFEGIVTKVSSVESPSKPAEIPGMELILVRETPTTWKYIYVEVEKSPAEEQLEIINTLGQELAMLKLQTMMGGM